MPFHPNDSGEAMLGVESDFSYHVRLLPGHDGCEAREDLVGKHSYAVGYEFPSPEGAGIEPPAWAGLRYEFQGWSVGGRVVQPGQSVELAGDLEATALWRADTDLWVGATRVVDGYGGNAGDVLGDGTVSYDAPSNALLLRGLRGLPDAAYPYPLHGSDGQVSPGHTTVGRALVAYTGTAPLSVVGVGDENSIAPGEGCPSADTGVYSRYAPVTFSGDIAIRAAICSVLTYREEAEAPQAASPCDVTVADGSLEAHGSLKAGGSSLRGPCPRWRWTAF